MVALTSISHLGVQRPEKKGVGRDWGPEQQQLSQGGFSKINHPGISWMCVTQRETV